MEDLSLLTVYQFDRKKRYGIEKDGGYVIAELDGLYDCYISAGVSNEESFSRDFIQDYNMHEYNCFAFDNSIDHYPYEYTNKISFIKKNVGLVNDENTTNLSYLMSNHNKIFLKMDIEGGEYPWLLHLTETQLNQCKQIVIEFHGIHGNEWGCSYPDKIKCLEKLSNTHYLIHAHGNNFGQVVNGIPDVIELSYVNKKLFKVPLPFNAQPLPIPHMDFPNNSAYNDIDLNIYPFVHKINKI